MEGESNILISATNLQNIDKISQYQENVYAGEYYICKGLLRWNSRLLQHLNTCRRKNKLFTEIYGFNVEAQCIDASRWSIQENPETFCFSKIPRSVFQKDLDEACEQIVYLQKNLLCFHQDLLVREL